MKFKIGDRVRFSDKKQEITGTIVMTRADGHNYRDSKGRYFSPPIICDYRVARDVDGYPQLIDEQDLESVRKDWDNLQVGDILVDKEENEDRVIGVCGEAIFIGYVDGSRAANYYYTAAELRKGGWTIKGAGTDDTVELSIAELEQKLGYEAGSLRVKKDAA